MTSQGHAYARFKRALEAGSPTAIRAAAAELRTVALEDALAVCLAFLDREPESYPRAAARFAGRLTLERSLTLREVHLATAALMALPEPAARAGAAALIELVELHGLRRVEDLFATWLERRGLVP